MYSDLIDLYVTHYRQTPPYLKLLFFSSSIDFFFFMFIAHITTRSITQFFFWSFFYFGITVEFDYRGASVYFFFINIFVYLSENREIVGPIMD